MAKKIFVFICIIMLVFQFFVYAVEKAPSVSVFIAEESDAIVTVRLLVSDVTYGGISCDISYNPESVAPVNKDTYDPTAVFSEFANKLEGTKEVYAYLDTENGRISFENLAIEGEMESSSDGILVYEFYFKKVADALIDFKFSHTEENPNGLTILSSDKIYSYAIQYTMPKSLGNSYMAVQVLEKTEAQKAQEAQAEKVRLMEIRAKDVIFIAMNNYASISNNALKHIDKEDKSVVPYIKSEVKMIPLRYIAEELGGIVSYNAHTQEIEIQYADVKIKMTIGSRDYFINDSKHEFSLVPETNSGRTFVPVDIVEQAFDRAVTTIDKDKMIIITGKENIWDPESTIEKSLYVNVKLLMSPLARDLAY